MGSGWKAQERVTNVYYVAWEAESVLLVAIGHGDASHQIPTKHDYLVLRSSRGTLLSASERYLPFLGDYDPIDRFRVWNKVSEIGYQGFSSLRAPDHVQFA